MPIINFDHPEIDPKKVEMFGPIDQPGDNNDRDEREFITPE